MPYSLGAALGEMRYNYVDNSQKASKSSRDKEIIMSFDFKDLNAGKGIPFMDGRDAGQLKDLVGQGEYSITDFAFLTDEDGDEYAAFTVAQDDARFYFANGVITEMLKKVEQKGVKDELPNAPIVFKTVTSKRGRDYTAFEFV